MMKGIRNEVCNETETNTFLFARAYFLPPQGYEINYHTKGLLERAGKHGR